MTQQAETRWLWAGWAVLSLAWLWAWVLVR